MKARRLGSGLRHACPENFSRQCLQWSHRPRCHVSSFSRSTSPHAPAVLLSFFYYIVQQRMKTSTYLLLLLFLYYIWFPCRSKESLEKRNETYKKLRWMIHMPSYEDKTYPRITWWLKEVAKYLINNNYIISLFVNITNFWTCYRMIEYNINYIMKSYLTT